MFFDSKECAWADMSILFNGKQIAKIKHVKFGKKQEKDELYAEGDQPHSIQRGNVSYTGELEVFKNVLDQVNEAVAIAGYEDILDVENVTLNVSFKASGLRKLKLYTLIGVEFTEYEIGLSQGDKSIPVKLPFKFLKLVIA
jgi:hypothetical protein